MFHVFDATQAIKSSNETHATLSYLLAATAAISLVAGGAGIMNIMLVSVTERTREIGLRRAIGARRRDILAQSMIEAILLCVAAGAAGVALGIGGAYIVASTSGWPVIIPSTTIALALVAAVGTGGSSSAISPRTAPPLSTPPTPYGLSRDAKEGIAMTLADLLKDAMRSLQVNTLRTALTATGVITGVAGVIVLGATNAGAGKVIEHQIEVSGYNVVDVYRDGSGIPRKSAARSWF